MHPLPYRYMTEPLQIHTVATSDLNPAPYNPRRWDSQQEKQLTESIKRFGFVDPLIVNGADERLNVVIGGHFRLHIARKLDMAEVPVVYISIPDIEKEKELNLRLNRNTGGWDWDLLKEFDLGQLMDVGFDDGDLSSIWDDALETDEDAFDTEAALAEITEPKTKRGDYFALGDSRLYCGDATIDQVVAILTQDRKPSMLYCDPPYNIGLSYDSGIGGKKHYGGSTNDNKTDDEYRIFLQATIQNGLKHATEDAHLFYWCDSNAIGLVQSLYREENVTPRRVALWVKNNANITPQIAFSKVHEPCVYGTRGKPYLSDRMQQLTEVLNKEVGTGNRCIEDVMDFLDLWLERRLPTDSYRHPTEKPPTLHEKPLRRCTKPGDTVLDLFGGSGSTLIACEQMKRIALLCEIEPVFCDLILLRYEQLTGNKPVQLACGWQRS